MPNTVEVADVLQKGYNEQDVYQNSQSGYYIRIINGNGTGIVVKRASFIFCEEPK